MKITFDNSKKQKPDYDSGMKVPYAPAKRAASTWKWYAVVIITASPLVFFLIKIIFSYIFISAPGILTFKTTILNSMETAAVQQIYVKKGDTVKVGTPLALLSYPDMEKRLHDVQAERDTIAAKENDTTSKPLNPENLKLSKKIRDDQKAYLDKVRYLYLKGAATYSELTLAENQSNQARLDWAKLKTEYESSRQRPRTSENEAALSRLDQTIESLKKKHLEPVYKSPIQGYVSQIFISEGQTASMGSQLFRISSPEGFLIKAYINPAQLKHAKKGKRVTVKFPDNQLVKGMISSDPETAGTIPSELSESFYESKQAVEINITLLSQLPDSLFIDGLPLKIYFGIPDFLYR